MRSSHEQATTSCPARAELVRCRAAAPTLEREEVTSSSQQDLQQLGFHSQAGYLYCDSVRVDDVRSRVCLLTLDVSIFKQEAVCALHTQAQPKHMCIYTLKVQVTPAEPPDLLTA